MSRKYRISFGVLLATATFSSIHGAPVLAQQAATPAVGSAIKLSDAIATALRDNPSSQAASEQVNQAQAALNQARAGQHFQLTFNSAPGVSNASVIQPPPSKETFGAIQNSLTIPLPVGPKPSLLSAQASSQLSEAAATYQSAQLALANKVASAYFDYLRKHALVAAAQLDLDTSKRELADAQARKNAGDIPELDLLQASVPVASGQAALITAQTTEATALETLNDLLNRPLDQPLDIVDITTPTPAPTYTVDEARAMALQSSPDIASADAAVRAAVDAAKAAGHYRDPTLSLQAIDLRSGDQTSFSREDTLQASITLPLDDGGLGRSTFDSATSALQQAKFNDQSARKAAVIAASSAYLEVVSSLAELDATQTALDIAQSTYDKTRLGYMNGLFPLVDALTAERALADARAAHIQALYDSASSRFTLDSAVSGYAILTTRNTNLH